MCLLNCGPTGTETIKNLVLGGIASFTLVDDAIVEARDLGNNFFVHASDLGQSKAKAVAAHLNELNTSVAGSFVDERPEDLVASNPDFADFTVVVATQMPRASLVALDAACRERGVILVALHARGLSGIVRLSLAEHTVVEAKPEETDFDLRVAAPWPNSKRGPPVRPRCARRRRAQTRPARRHPPPSAQILARGARRSRTRERRGAARV